MYINGKPPINFFMSLIKDIQSIFKKRKEESEWQQKLKDGYGKGIKNK